MRRNGMHSHLWLILDAKHVGAAGVALPFARDCVGTVADFFSGRHSAFASKLAPTGPGTPELRGRGKFCPSDRVALHLAREDCTSAAEDLAEVQAPFASKLTPTSDVSASGSEVEAGTHQRRAA